ncbi:PKD domain-containing protein, partial [Vibrio cincinnatiensis]
WNGVEGDSTYTTTFSEEGTETVTLVVVDNDGLVSAAAKHSVEVVPDSTNIPPVAKISAPDEAKVGEPVIFDGSASFDDDGSVVRYFWNGVEGDSTYTTTFSEEGTETVTLVVVDNDGLVSAAAKHSVEVVPDSTNIPPVAKISAPDEAKVGELVIFDGSASFDDDGSVVSYFWNGDEDESTHSQTFSEAGEYSVTLYVVDDDGAISATETKTITVSDLIVPATIAISPAGPLSLEQGKTQQLSATVTYSDDSTAVDPEGVAWSCEGSNVSVTASGLLSADAVSSSNSCSAHIADDVTDAQISVTVTDPQQTVEPVVLDRLGAMYDTDQTRFAIWAPDSSSVEVKITSPEGVDLGTHPLTKGSFSDYVEQVYQATVADVPLYSEYQFYLDGNPVRDPYGMMVKPDTDINIVMAHTQKGPKGADWAARPALAEREDAIIYEIHIRDFTISDTSGVDEDLKGTFSGFVQLGTTLPGDSSIKTGIDHLKELGVTHVQILPMYDFATCSGKTTPDNVALYKNSGFSWETDCYNWGYDPENYNIPEEYYASVAKDDYQARMDEVKYFVNELHKAGIRVIMDVVYNHSYLYVDNVTSDWDGGNWSSTSPQNSDGSYQDDYVHETMFSPITDRYFFESDLSGTGNALDVSTTNPMVSRMIRDSLEYWVSEYGIDGFRFDLVGIFDHQVYGDWGRYLNEKYPDRNLLIYGEPWNGYASDSLEDQRVRYWTVAQQASAHVGVFNGIFREAIKGGNDDAAGGFINDAYARIGWGGTPAITNIKNGVKGSLGDARGGWDYATFTSDPEQSINYVSAHDNLTLGDKINKVVPGGSDYYKKQLSMYANGIVFTSQGIPFIHGGAELYRVKDNALGSAHNSYRSPDFVNEIDWNWKADNKLVFDYYKNMIAMRKAHPSFRMNTASEINGNINTWDDNGVVITHIFGNPNNDSWSEIKIFYNTGNNYTTDANGWKLAVSGQDAAVGGTTIYGNVTAEGSAVTVIYKD